MIEPYLFEKCINFAMKLLGSSMEIKRLAYALIVQIYEVSRAETRMVIETNSYLTHSDAQVLTKAFDLVDSRRIDLV